MPPILLLHLCNTSLYTVEGEVRRAAGLTLIRAGA
jgi:hypothetical protein